MLIDQPVALTDEEKGRIQEYCLKIRSRNPDARPAKDERLETVAYYYQEAMRPAPDLVKQQASAQLEQAIINWRTQ